MTVYLGTQGLLQLQRQLEVDSVVVTLKASDVNATKNRFSVRFSENKSYGSDFLLTGDEVRIERTDGGVLDLVTSNTAKGTKKFTYRDRDWET